MAEYKADPNDPNGPLTKDACDRLISARRQKREWEPDIREGYFFAAPHRARQIQSEQQNNTAKPTDADLLQTGMAFELVEDFATVVLNAFMPPAEPWAEQRAGMFVPDDVLDEVKKQIGENDPKIFEAIRASNLYEELPKAWVPDLAIGTTALWIEDSRPAENFVVQAIPLHELEINVGPFGSLDDRFVVRHTKNRHVAALLGQTIFDKLSAECRKEVADGPDKLTQIAWGYWRKWDRRDDVVWQHVVMLKNKVVHDELLIGEGSCPLIPMRWAPSPEWAFGNGVLIKSLPDLRQVDDLSAKKIEHIDNALAPASTYPDDSFTAVEQGIETGKLYPMRVGSEGAVKPIFPPGSVEAALFELDQTERKLRRRFFLDWPEQRGDTPPTATQWLDEMQMAQRRIGTPGQSFWREGPAEIFLRYKFLLEKRGVIAPVQVNGKNVALSPYNPAQRAAEQQEVAMFSRFAEIMAPLFPEEWKLKTDGGVTMAQVAEKMRVTKLWAERPADQQKAALAQISQLAGGQAPGAAAPAGGAPPMAPQ